MSIFVLFVCFLELLFFFYNKPVDCVLDIPTGAETTGRNVNVIQHFNFSSNT